MHASLGPSETYFVQGMTGTDQMLSIWLEFSGFPEEDPDMISRIWWGHSNTYVVERRDGSRTWSLGTNYAGLSDYIRWGVNGCSEIKALALDQKNGQSWIIIFTNGEVAYSRRANKSDDKFDHFGFEEFAARNFGCDFGFMEETKKEATPRSSGPMSKPKEATL
ncbi:hypothetical protein B0T26DRAFT_428483 [Lasiosphaeria miniovina]|uniref:Uncharacterized protein n=1 Tax=Lasiosphaeria miniovina TaxID=1954250 RepID=A0AA40DS31_9PEZI|nr:uncharacterized protein B0T26DRAFT_428483 [Lasiosphaeria miniovina]KAK0709908.1 hypothetical protein B0T26DRAFT_428483 [Lasiosphaeria miniovina]